MMAKPTTLLLACCGLACVTTVATANPTAMMVRHGPNHLYINMRTGNRVVSSGSTPPGGFTGLHVFINEDYSMNGDMFWMLDDPARTGTIPAFGTEGADWGDIHFDTLITELSVGYCTMSGLEVAPATSLPGFSMLNWFYDCDGGYGDSSAVPTAVILLSSAPAAHFTTGASCWIVTFDFDPLPLTEIGDTDGTANGVSTGSNLGGDNQGCDKDDTDGNPKGDFGWSYTFIQGQAESRGVTGPYLVLPASYGVGEDDHFPTGGSGNARGVDDAVSWYATPTDSVTLAARSGFIGTFNFGGWPTHPYASLYIGLYGILACTLADYNDDGFIDGSDSSDFLRDYALCAGCSLPVTCPPAVFDKLDRYNLDGCVDWNDIAAFFDIFGRCR
ncbi:MAG: hypothetical protein KIT19_08405 [Phycisphaeraceae bacterium]|nr:hypothetical protein [Phycisphaeraceae bacterium]